MMKTNLLYQNETLAVNSQVFGERELVRDLKLDLLLDVMAGTDVPLRTICKTLLLHPLRNKSEILLRQEVLKEALLLNNFFTSIYKLSVEDIELTSSFKELTQPKYNKIIPVIKRVITHMELADLHITYLEQLHEKCIFSQPSISCPLVQDFCNEILKTYTPEYLFGIKSVIKELSCLKINSELVFGGHIGSGLKTSDISLHAIIEPQTSPFKTTKSDAVIMLDTIVLINNSQEIVDALLSPLLKTLSEFNQECCLLFERMREMFGYYVGAINLYRILQTKGGTICFPTLSEHQEFCFSNLTDIGLVLKNTSPVIGNTCSFSNKKLCMITGMNQGGKTTFLRSIGLAQLMTQCGLFVTAEAFECNIFNGIYTHFPNEEDRTLNKGLLEQELFRLDELVSHMQSGSLLLMNETFATTSEYDASLIAEQIISAFCECKITTFFVTHLYEYAHKLYLTQSKDCIFFRANQSPDKGRNFQLVEGEPLRSAFAMNLYHQIIG